MANARGTAREASKQAGSSDPFGYSHEKLLSLTARLAY